MFQGPQPAFQYHLYYRNGSRSGRGLVLTLAMENSVLNRVTLVAIGVLSAVLVPLAGGSFRTCQAAEPTVADLVKQLSGSEAQARYRATDELANHGEAAKDAVPALIKALGDSDPKLRFRAARALGAIGPVAQESGLQLVARLKDEDALVRAHSAHALGNIGAVNDAVVPELAHTLADADPNVRRSAIRAIQKIKPGPDVMLPLVSKLLEDDNPSVVLHALQSMAEAGDRALPVIIGALDNQKSRYWACVVLAELGPAAKSAAPALAKVLSDEDPEERMQALIALGEIGPAAKEVVPQIAKSLQDKQGSVAYGAAFALGKIGDKSANAALEKEVVDNDKFLAMISAWALAMINPDDVQISDRAAEMLIAGTTDEKPVVRTAAVRGLAELHDKHPEAIRALVIALKDPEPEVMGGSLQGLISLGPDAVPELTKALADKDLQVAAAAALGQIGMDATSAIPAIIAQLPGEDPGYRREAHFALAAMGPAAAAAVPELIKSLADDDLEVRYSASYALGKLGPAAKSALPALKANVKSDDEFLRLASIWSMLSIAPNEPGLAEMALPQLIDALDDERPLIRREAATALGELGPRGKQAIPALKKSVSVEPDPDVKAAAEEALKRIEG